MLRDFAADAAFTIEHYLREHHPVERFAMFEGKEDRCDRILAERTRCYVSWPGCHFR